MTHFEHMQADLKTRLAREINLILRLKSALVTRLHALGMYQFDGAIDSGLVDFHLKTDPFDHSESLCAQWINNRGEGCGNLQILGNGQLYAEFDVLLDHPGDDRWFIEAITAWGKDGEIRTDFQLLQALRD